jgi:hypothetical protein
MPNTNRLNVPFGAQAGAGSAKRALTYNDPNPRTLTVQDEVLNDLIQQALFTYSEPINEWTCGGQIVEYGFLLLPSEPTVLTGDTGVHVNNCGTVNVNYTITNMPIAISFGRKNYYVSNREMIATPLENGNTQITYTFILTFNTVIATSYTEEVEANYNGMCYYVDPINGTKTYSDFNSSCQMENVSIPMTLTFEALSLENIPNSLETYKSDIIPFNLVGPIIDIQEGPTYTEYQCTEIPQGLFPPIEKCGYVTYDYYPKSFPIQPYFIKSGNYYGLFTTNVNISIQSGKSITINYPNNTATICADYNNFSTEISSTSFIPYFTKLFSDVFTKINSKFDNKMCVFSQYVAFIYYTCTSASNCYNCVITNYAKGTEDITIPTNYTFGMNYKPGIIYEKIIKEVPSNYWYNLWGIPD